MEKFKVKRDITEEMKDIEEAKHELSDISSEEEREKEMAELRIAFKKVMSLHDPRFANILNPIPLKPRDTKYYKDLLAPPETEEEKAARLQLFKEHEETSSAARVQISRAKKYAKVLDRSIAKNKLTARIFEDHEKAINKKITD